ncbi:LacI family DNA-binding transcriptional regulator [Agathobaculum sp. Marseille-P7918]|uniref:LacI family DNA-binding transcriptional regulator n=1 Tax=Agathobaculum sp. Marseille-P7918 TaxID=2479843 RepID=UPI003568BE37
MSITLNQIAELCGVSRGTVDRALHNKGNVRPEIAARIKRVAAEHGYTPNRAGMALSRASHPIRIGVVMHSSQTPFMQLVLDSCRREANRLSAFSTKVIFRLSRSLDPVEQVSMIEELVEEQHISGLAIASLHSILVENKLNELIQKRNLPVITFNTDLPHSKRFCYVGQDNFAAGRTSAELMRLVTGGHGIVAPIIGPSEYHFAYSERLAGFQSEIAQIAPQIALRQTNIAADDDACAMQATLTLLEQVPELAGIYAITPGYAGVCQALIQTGRAQDVRLILHDEITTNLHYLKDGVVDFVIGQDAEMQGALPLSLLADFIQLRQRPAKAHFFTDIRVLLKYNIDNLLQ